MNLKTPSNVATVFVLCILFTSVKISHAQLALGGEMGVLTGNFYESTEGGIGVHASFLDGPFSMNGRIGVFSGGEKTLITARDQQTGQTTVFDGKLVSRIYLLTGALQYFAVGENFEDGFQLSTSFEIGAIYRNMSYVITEDYDRNRFNVPTFESGQRKFSPAVGGAIYIAYQLGRVVPFINYRYLWALVFSAEDDSQGHFLGLYGGIKFNLIQPREIENYR